jgi:hypothetical protein
MSCGNSICSYCVSSIQINKDKEFQCLVCHDKHKMPETGLPINIALKELLSCKPANVSRGKAHDSLQATLKDFISKRNILKNRLENREDFVKEYCIDLRSQVQLVTEDLHVQIDQFNEQMIGEIDAYQKNAIKFNFKESESLKRFHLFVDELDKFHLEITNYLNELNLNDDKLNESNREALLLKDKTELEILNLRDFILNDTFLSFESNKERISKSVLGELKIAKSTHFESNILPDINKVNELMVLCEFSSNQKFSLIYRASHDGFEAVKFHEKCDDKPNTFILIKSENKNVFGCYTEQSWSGKGGKTDPNAFIFSLVNKINRPLKIKSQSEYSINCDIDSGPCFGLFGDFCISSNNEGIKNYSKFGSHCYAHKDFTFRSSKADSFLAGSEYFQVSEIEVFIKQNYNFY